MSKKKKGMWGEGKKNSAARLLLACYSPATVGCFRGASCIKVAEWYKGRMVLGGSGKVSFGRRIRAGPYLRIQSELYTHCEVVSSPK